MRVGSSARRPRRRALTALVVAGAFAIAWIQAAPAQADEPLTTIGIVDVGAWQETEGVQSTIWVDGTLDPAPTRGRVSIDVDLPGVGKSSQEVRPSKKGTFRWGAVLPPEASGNARIRIKVTDACVETQPIAFPSLTLRMDVAPWVPSLPLTQTGGDNSQYRFIHVDAQGQPAQWDPCRPLIYQVDTRRIPGDYLPYVHEAMGRLRQATGLDFMYGGEPSAEVAADPRKLPDSTILIGWSDPTALPILDGSSLAVADLIPVKTADQRLRIRNGWVILDSTENLTPGFVADKSLGQVLLHELGHVMNLDHVLEPIQLMYPYLSDVSPADYANGDLAGLAWARSPGCLN
ncbi:MAG: matrixin family metalloprotease [Actinomycetales bacterium]